jgi:oligosaccharyl transferase (archaeosortase A-associated)
MSRVSVSRSVAGAPRLAKHGSLCDTRRHVTGPAGTLLVSLRRTRVKRKQWPGLIAGLLVLVFFGVALWMRVALPYNSVFTADGIVFTGNDAYYHMRLVESLVHNFPHFPGIDPYLAFPGSPTPVVPSFFQWLLGVVLWIVGLGSPSEHTVNLVGAYFPAVLGALTTVPAFFIARELWGKHGKWAGVVAAALVALLPGEFLGRSILGFTDQHVAETLLSTTSVLFLIMAVKSAASRELSWGHFLKLRWDKILRPGLFAVLSGLFLGMYIFAWQGALLVVFAMAVFFVVQFVIDHLKGRATGYLATVGTLLFLVTLIFIPVAQNSLYAPALVIATLMPMGLGLLSSAMGRRKIIRVLYPLGLVVVGLAGFGLLNWIRPALVTSMLEAFKVFKPSGTLLATVEAQSIFTSLRAGGGFFDSPAWINFYNALPVALAATVVLVVRGVIKQGNPERCAFLVWSLVMLAATIGQRRFAYYFAVNVALLAGYASILVYYVVTWVLAYTGGDRTRTWSWRVLELEGLGVRPLSTEAPMALTSKRARRRERQLARHREMESRRAHLDETRSVTLVRDYVSVGLSAVLIFMLLFSQLILFPDPAHGLTKPPAVATASSAPYAPSGAWVKALTWMRDNTPAPLGSADAYWRHYSVQEDFAYPASAYGVTAWWDYGYWITYIGHRMPSANPGQEPASVTKVARFLVAQDEALAEAIAAEMKSGYVVMDYQTAASKFWAVATWAGQTPSEFFEVYWDPKQNQQKLYIYPEYYRSISTRLYSFDGQAVAGTNPLVVSYQQRTNADGQSYREVVSEQQFATYEEASAYLAGQTSGTYVIAGTDPLVSPVPLAALQNYRSVYNSDSLVSISSANQTAEIKIFERTR